MRIPNHTGLYLEPLGYKSIFGAKVWGVGVKRGPCMCRTNVGTLAYITLWYVHIPRTDQNRPRYVHLAIAIDIEVCARKCNTELIGWNCLGVQRVNSCPIKVNSNTIELAVHTSCYCVLDLLCVT